MNFLKTKKKLCLGIISSIIICILTSLLIFMYFNNSSVETSSLNTINQNNIITDITTKNETVNNILTVFLDYMPEKEEITETKKTPETVTNEKTSSKEEQVNKKEPKKSTSPYYIKINYKANVVTIYKKDKNDKYTVPYKAMICSCGTYTPKSGTYKTSDKYRWGKLIHDVYGQYATRIVGSILFHSVPYSSNTNDSLLYKQYDKLGTSASAGCIRLTVEDAKWIYDNCPKGTIVEFYSNSDPGPLGKPTAQKISSVKECRNWDPTDPAAQNPWHTYKPETENNKPTTDVPSTNIPNTGEPIPDTPTTDIPSTEKPSENTPSTDTPSTEEPNENTPSTNTPSTEKPNENTPSTDTPSTEEPNENTPSTDTPSTEEPNENTPSTDTPSTEKPNENTSSSELPDTNTTKTSPINKEII